MENRIINPNRYDNDDNPSIGSRNLNEAFVLTRSHITISEISNNSNLDDNANDSNISNNNSYYSQVNEFIAVHKLDDLLINNNNSLIKNEINDNKKKEEIKNLDDEEKIEQNTNNISFDLSKDELSAKFKCLENIYCFNNELELALNEKKENIYDIYDKLLEEIKNSFISLNIKINPRKYRDKYPASFCNTFKDNNFEYYSLFLDNALINSQYVIVNKEKYIFTQDLIHKANEFYSSYLLLIKIVKEYHKEPSELINTSLDISKIIEDFSNCLIAFDKNYILYEEKLISELLFVERMAKKFIIEIIDIEKEMKSFENKHGLIGQAIFTNSSNKKEYNNIREKFVNKINILNEKYNINGSGRTDLDINILNEAENILITVTEIQSPVLRKLANEVVESLNNFRILFNDYRQNIELLDPELANDQKLSDYLFIWEKAWEKGKKYLCDKIYSKKLLNFNTIINLIVEKYKDQNIKKLFEQNDPEIFIIIPSILILDAIDRHDNEIIEEFIQDLKNNKIFKNIKDQIKKVYKQLKDKNIAYNCFEALILFQHFKNDEFFLKSHKKLKEILNDTEINDFLRDINILSMNIQRNKPIDWNEFIELAFNIKT